MHSGLFIVSLAHMIYDSSIKLIIMIAAERTQRKTQMPNIKRHTIHRPQCILFIQTQNTHYTKCDDMETLHPAPSTHTHTRRRANRHNAYTGWFPFQIT